LKIEFNHLDIDEKESNLSIVSIDSGNSVDSSGSIKLKVKNAKQSDGIDINQENLKNQMKQS
jgi:hypothetical protein